MSEQIVKNRNSGINNFIAGQQELVRQTREAEFQAEELHCL
jgi:hypothetical protein